MDNGINIAGVQFRRAGKIYDFRYDDIGLTVGDHVVVDTDRGPSLARVVMLKFETESKNADRELKSIARKASKKELEKKPKVEIDEVLKYTKDRIKTLKLDMNILNAEIQFGGNKITVFFTSPGRVDFRELVKDLASGLKARVELKQVGARDETKLIGGTGICGREFCCSSFLREFVPVSIKMAKNQNLALNPNKVSGGCGRLLCCLTYEDDTYTSLRKNIPKKGTKVFIPETGGYGNVLKGDVLNQEVVIENERGQQETYALDDLEILDKQTPKAKQPQEADEWGDDIDLDALEQFSKGDSGAQKANKRPDSKGKDDRQNRNGRNRNGGNRNNNNNNRNRNKPRNDNNSGGEKTREQSQEGSGENKPNKKGNRNRGRRKYKKGKKPGGSSEGSNS